MSKKYTKETFTESLDRRLSGFQADPWLARRIIGASEGEKPVKKISLGAILAAALLCILITGAVAAVVTQGRTLDDFWKWLEEGGETKLPDNYEKTVLDEVAQNEVITAEDEHAVYTIPGYYCDGKTLMAVINVTPKENVLPVWYDDDVAMNIPMAEHYYRSAVTEEITVAEYALKYHDGNVAQFRVGEADNGEPVFCGDSDAVVLNEDGSISIMEYMDIRDPSLTERKVQIEITCRKGKVSGDAAQRHADLQEEDSIIIPMTIRTVKAKEYVCKDGFDLPDVGLRVTEVRLEVNPLEILCKLDFEVTDAELYGAQWTEREVHVSSEIGDVTSESTEMQMMDMLLYEFVYPEGKEDGTAGEKVPDGPGGYPSIESIYYPEPVNGAVFHASFPISLDALGDRYAVRAYNMETGERFGTVEFTVKPVEE